MFRSGGGAVSSQSNSSKTPHGGGGKSADQLSFSPNVWIEEVEANPTLLLLSSNTPIVIKGLSLARSPALQKRLWAAIKGSSATAGMLGRTSAGCDVLGGLLRYGTYKTCTGVCRSVATSELVKPAAAASGTMTAEQLLLLAPLVEAAAYRTDIAEDRLLILNPVVDFIVAAAATLSSSNSDHAAAFVDGESGVMRCIFAILAEKKDGVVADRLVQSLFSSSATAATSPLVSYYLGLCAVKAKNDRAVLRTLARVIEAARQSDEIDDDESAADEQQQQQQQQQRAAPAAVSRALTISRSLFDSAVQLSRGSSAPVRVPFLVSMLPRGGGAQQRQQQQRNSSLSTTPIFDQVAAYVATERADILAAALTAAGGAASSSSASAAAGGAGAASGGGGGGGGGAGSLGNNSKSTLLAALLNNASAKPRRQLARAVIAAVEGNGAGGGAASSSSSLSSQLSNNTNSWPSLIGQAQLPQATLAAFFAMHQAVQASPELVSSAEMGNVLDAAARHYLKQMLTAADGASAAVKLRLAARAKAMTRQQRQNNNDDDDDDDDDHNNNARHNNNNSNSAKFQTNIVSSGTTNVASASASLARSSSSAMTRNRLRLIPVNDTSSDDDNDEGNNNNNNNRASAGAGAKSSSVSATRLSRKQQASPPIRASAGPAGGSVRRQRDSFGKL